MSLWSLQYPLSSVADQGCRKKKSTTPIFGVLSFCFIHGNGAYLILFAALLLSITQPTVSLFSAVQPTKCILKMLSRCRERLGQFVLCILEATVLFYN